MKPNPDTEALLARLRTKLLSGGFGKAEADAVMPTVNARGRIVLTQDASPLGSFKAREVEAASNTQGQMDAFFSMIASHRRHVKYEQGLVRAMHFVNGTSPDEPYMVHAVADAFLRSCGRDWRWFGEQLSLFVPEAGMGTLSQLERAVGRSFQNWTVGGKVHPFERYYKQSTARNAHELRCEWLGPVQFMLQRSGSGLTMDMKLGKATWESSGTPCLSVPDKFPEQICNGAKGRHIAELVRHPALQVPGLTITSMRWVGNRTIIQVRNVLVDVKQERIHGRAALALAA